VTEAVPFERLSGDSCPKPIYLAAEFDVVIFGIPLELDSISFSIISKLKMEEHSRFPAKIKNKRGKRGFIEFYAGVYQ
jgi:hypothetical protein